MSTEEIFYFTVGDLKRILEDFPSDMPVLVSGYDSGYENFTHPYVIKVEHNPESYYKDGQFEHSATGIEVLILEREWRDD